MECKSAKNYGQSADSVTELIDTLWNVNFGKRLEIMLKHIELIDTLWNVNTNLDDVAKQLGFELIDTLWNVNLAVGRE